MKTENIKKVAKITFDVLLYCFLGLCVIALVCVFNARQNGNDAVSMFNHEVRIVVTNSMEKCELTDVSKYKIKDLPVKSAVVIEKVPEKEQKSNEWYRKLKKGDVLTFKYYYTKQLTITHRLVDITEKSTGGFILKLEGDNKSSESPLSQTIDTSEINSYNYVIGKVVLASYPLGIVLSSLQSPVGLSCIIIIPSFIIIIYEVMKIINVLTKDKKLKLKEESLKKDNEIEELKSRLALLEKQNSDEKREDS